MAPLVCLGARRASEDRPLLGGGGGGRITSGGFLLLHLRSHDLKVSPSSEVMPDEQTEYDFCKSAGAMATAHTGNVFFFSPPLALGDFDRLKAPEL